MQTSCTGSIKVVKCLIYNWVDCFIQNEQINLSWTGTAPDEVEEVPMNNKTW